MHAVISQEGGMRTMGDRVRHTVGFEVIGLLLCIPLAIFVFEMKAHEAGGLAVAASLIATVWNLIYNYVVDRLMAHYLARLEKTVKERVLHAICFELGLLLILLPLGAWWLNISLWQALIIDIGLVVFYLIYAFFYNLAYDQMFPVTLNNSFKEGKKSVRTA